jgi:hypothetical protein
MSTEKQIAATGCLNAGSRQTARPLPRNTISSRNAVRHDLFYGRFILAQTFCHEYRPNTATETVLVVIVATALPVPAAPSKTASRLERLRRERRKIRRKSRSVRALQRKASEK